MTFDPQKHHRRSIRMPDYDYSQPGAYFITIVTYGREYLFGEIAGGEMHLNDAGQMVWEVWNSLPARYPQIATGAAVVMPNHFHGIVEIRESCVGAIHETDPVGAIHKSDSVGAIHESDPVGAIHELPLQLQQPQRGRRRMTLPLVVGYFKMNAAKRINEILGSAGVPVWQRNYYEHVIRDDEEYNRIHLYIDSNVDNWVSDEENPGNLK